MMITVILSGGNSADWINKHIKQNRKLQNRFKNIYKNLVYDKGGILY